MSSRVQQRNSDKPSTLNVKTLIKIVLRILCVGTQYKNKT